ncbi:hypothetical protein H4Q26_009721 [Puccinia striiformis f. sp. tritici PST-130]|nr:hypothetical protein H4Q26_009721 [Puccinia striiformis f. sp. tritici PST-130]
MPAQQLTTISSHSHSPSQSITQKRTMAETLDLSHQRIADLTQPVLEELAEYVETFSLTRMPSLEILDVSRNKIKAFPRRPGSLDRLRVLSVSRNRIKRLPNYVANLTTLRVLKIDHNPVIWPPKELVTFTDLCERADEVDEGVDLNHQVRDDDRSTHHTRTRTHSNETNTSMAHWLRTLQEWMRKNPYVRPVKQTRPSTGETSADPSVLIALDFSTMTLIMDRHPPIPPSSIPATRNNNNNSKTHDHMLQHNRTLHLVQLLNGPQTTRTTIKEIPTGSTSKSCQIMVERNADMIGLFRPESIS